MASFRNKRRRGQDSDSPDLGMTSFKASVGGQDAPDATAHSAASQSFAKTRKAVLLAKKARGGRQRLYRLVLAACLCSRCG